MIDKQAIRMAIHAMSDSEVEYEAKQTEEKAKLFQSIADKLRKEMKRRNRERKAHVAP